MKFYHVYDIQRAILVPLYINDYNDKFSDESRVTYLNFGVDSIEKYHHLQPYNFLDSKISTNKEDYRMVIKKLFTLGIKR